MADENPSFIKESVNKKSGSRTVRRIIRYILSAVLFGVIAVFAAVIARPLAEKCFAPEEETVAETTITIERDTESETEAETEPEREVTLINETTEPETSYVPLIDSEKVSETLEEMVGDAVENYQFSISNTTEMWNSVSELCGSIDSRIVTIKTITEGKDWLDNNVEEMGLYTGVLIAVTENEAMILAPAEPADGSSSIHIEWATGLEQEAEIRGRDEVTGLSVLSVKFEEMDSRTKDSCMPVALGNSYVIERGNMLILMGAPVEEIGSTAYTWVSYIDPRAEITDGRERLMFTKDTVDQSKGTWAFNTDGELVGWITDRFSDRQCIAATSSIKPLIERMINAGEYSYLGIIPAEIDEDMTISGMPEGVYVKSVISGSPAYAIGIQPGDIITKIGENEVMSVTSFEKTLEDTACGEEIDIAVNRQGRKEYREIIYTTVTEKR